MALPNRDARHHAVGHEMGDVGIMSAQAYGSAAVSSVVDTGGLGGIIHVRSSSSHKYGSSSYPLGVGIINIGGTSTRNKSCLLCHARKRKCDGDGVNRCSLCVSKGPEQQCLYGTRRRQRPRASKALTAAAAVKRTADDGLLLMGNTQSQLRDLVGVSSLKRCRLSASPATGLVGMEENAILGDYFRCFGILSFASESQVRHAMVGIMCASARQRQMEMEAKLSMDNDDTLERHPSYQITEAGLGSGARDVWSDNRTGGALQVLSPADPATCMLWCAVALGAVVRGQPIGQVYRYVELARQALAGCFDDGTIGTARAYIAMAFLHNFLGDKAKNEKYVQFAFGVVSELPKEEVPLDLLELINFEDHTGKVCEEQLQKPIDMPECYGQVVARPKKGGYLLERDISSFLLWADRRVDQAFYEDMEDQGAVKGHHKVPLEDNDSSSDTTLPRAPCHPSEMWTVPDSEEGHVQLTPLGEDPLRERDGDWSQICDGLSWKAPCPSDNSRKLVEDMKEDMEQIALVADRSDLSCGVGGLILYGNRAYLRAVNNETEGAFADISRCADVIARFPGLCRYTSWSHVAHCCLAVFAKHESARGYEKVRRAVNPVRPEKHLQIPPLEEWQGMSSICDHLFCRSIGQKIKGRYSADNHDSALDAKGGGEAVADGILSRSAPSENVAITVDGSVSECAFSESTVSEVDRNGLTDPGMQGRVFDGICPDSPGSREEMPTPIEGQQHPERGDHDRPEDRCRHDPSQETHRVAAVPEGNDDVQTRHGNVVGMRGDATESPGGDFGTGPHATAGLEVTNNFDMSEADALMTLDAADSFLLEGDDAALLEGIYVGGGVVLGDGDSRARHENCNEEAVQEGLEGCGHPCNAFPMLLQADSLGAFSWNTQEK